MLYSSSTHKCHKFKQLHIFPGVEIDLSVFQVQTTKNINITLSVTFVNGNFIEKMMNWEEIINIKRQDSYWMEIITSPFSLQQLISHYYIYKYFLSPTI